MLVLRDLVGIEPLGGLYRPLSGERKPRGLLRAEARDDGVPGYSSRDYLEEDAFWSQVERSRSGSDKRRPPRSSAHDSWTAPSGSVST